eukprot:Gb_10520 [translate_table: standard]
MDDEFNGRSMESFTPTTFKVEGKETKCPTKIDEKLAQFMEQHISLDERVKENGLEDYDREIGKESEKEIIDRESEEEVDDENFKAKGKILKGFIKSVPKRRVDEENAGQINNQKVDQEVIVGTSKFVPCTKKETMDKDDDCDENAKEQVLQKKYFNMMEDMKDELTWEHPGKDDKLKVFSFDRVFDNSTRVVYKEHKLTSTMGRRKIASLFENN